jgi:hypothetical protein
MLAGAGWVYGQEYSWNKAQARVLETGDLEWAPEAFEYRPGPMVKYIDFEGGSDDNPGTKAKPWKHHPWDLQATGQPAGYRVPGTTYVFKGGVVYRGAMIAEEAAPGTMPTQLTCDPDWGDGRAVICGSELVKGWKKGAGRDDIPEAGKVWVADVDFLTHRLWVVDEQDKATKLKLARTPNWEESNPDDVLSEWWTWKRGRTGQNPDNPEQKMIVGEDPRLTQFPKEVLKGATLWTKWGFVMGTPIATEILGADVSEGKVAFRGVWWGSNRAQNVSTGHRYYLENKPQFLDQAGEMWVEKTGENSARIYARMPGDKDPNSLQIEAAKRYALVESRNLRNVEISNLAFRFNNRDWRYGLAWFFGKNIAPAAIQIDGSARDVSIGNCTFEHCITAIKAHAKDDKDRIANLEIHDNDLRDVVNKGFIIDIGKNPIGTGPYGWNVSILRNRMLRIGARAERTSNSAGIHVNYVQTLEIAGNILDRMYGPGIFVFGGKSSGAEGEALLTRILIHHNKVTDSLLTASDWGGIETWQGGPQYVWNNVSGNPGGYHNKKYDKVEGSRFGHAYYIDGGFKNYYFNNIAWGNNNEIGSPLANTAGIQGIIGYQNTFLNNTIYKFRQGSRQQRPENGRNKHLGNIWQDISQYVFYYARPRGKQAAEPNQMDVPDDKGAYAYATMAWANNVFHDISGHLGAFEESGRWFEDVEAFSKALQQRGTLTTDVGVMAEKSPLRDPDDHDFRLSPGSPAVDYGCKTFVPWGLYSVVGEWPFTVNREDPTLVIDEHWNMPRYFRDRKGYMDQPTYPLKAVNVSKKDYVSGPLEDWTQGALKLNGKDQYLMLEHEKTVESIQYNDQVRVPGGWAIVQHPDQVKPGETFKVKVELPNDVDLGRKLILQLGYTVPRNWGGMMYVSQAQTVTGEGPYEFEVKSKDIEDLRAMVLVVSYSKTGKTDNIIRNGMIRIGKAEQAGKSGELVTTTLDRYTKKVQVSGSDIRSPQIYQSNFLIETYIKVEPGSKGVICQKWSDGGYMLKVDENGKVMFRAGRGDKLDHNSPILRSKTKIADGKWHHVIAESSRTSYGFRIYVDGKLDVSGPGLFSAQKLQNEGDFYVGGTDEGENLACTIEFLRISQGTLADARTTIQELYKWQFDGPQFRDFRSKSPKGKRDAGAIEKLD